MVGIQNVSPEYKLILTDRYNNADSVSRDVFDKFASQMIICDNNFSLDRQAFYHPGNDKTPRGVYYSALADKNNPRGSGTTYYHELGHMIDNAATGFKGNLSNTKEFKKALKQDAKNILHLYRKYSDEDKKKFINRLKADENHSLSDLLDGLTHGRIQGKYGHRRSYWRHKGNFQAEAFAHFFEASMGSPKKLQTFKVFFPNSMKIFETMLGSIR